MKTKQGIMEQLFNNPGLIHIGEMIFEQLNNKSLVYCSKVCLNWRNILDNPRIWLNICIKRAPKLNEIDQHNKNIHLYAAKVLINQWKELISKNKYEITNLLKKMHADEIQKSFRSPIYMALLVDDIPLIRHLLWTYKNYFIANKKSKRLSFYDVSNSSYRIVIAYLINILQSNEDAPNGLVTVIKNNRKLQKFLMFILEYIVANFPKERYEILYVSVFCIILILILYSTGIPGRQVSAKSCISE